MKSKKRYNYTNVLYKLTLWGNTVEKLSDLIKDSSKQHYHTLAIIVDSELDKEKILETSEFLISLGWEVYDVDKIIISMLDKIPENKVKIRINEEFC